MIVEMGFWGKGGVCATSWVATWVFRGNKLGGGNIMVWGIKSVGDRLGVANARHLLWSGQEKGMDEKKEEGNCAEKIGLEVGSRIAASFSSARVAHV
jgi:hypothetical protein